MVAFQRLTKPVAAITATISTICASLQCLRSSSEHRVGDGVRHGAGGGADLERRLLGRAEQRARRRVRDGRELLGADAEMQRAARRMRHRIDVACCAACNMGDQPLQTTVDLAVRSPDRALQADEGAHQRRLALHRQHAVRHEAERLEERVELLLQLGRMLRRQRIEPAHPVTARFAGAAGARRPPRCWRPCRSACRCASAGPRPPRSAAAAARQRP